MNLLNPAVFLKQHSFVAVSGGVDSVALLHRVLQFTRDITVVHYCHNHSEYSAVEFDFVSTLCMKYDLNLLVGTQLEQKRSTDSLEMHWRRGRVAFLMSLGDPVLTGHTLDDAVEWYLLSCLRGKGAIMPFSTENLMKPLLLIKKSTIIQYAKANKLEWIEDPTNHLPTSSTRVQVRNNIIPSALQINPGLYSVIKRQIYTNSFIKP